MSTIYPGRPVVLLALALLMSGCLTGVDDVEPAMRPTEEGMVMGLAPTEQAVVVARIPIPTDGLAVNLSLEWSHSSTDGTPAIRTVMRMGGYVAPDRADPLLSYVATMRHFERPGMAGSSVSVLHQGVPLDTGALADLEDDVPSMTGGAWRMRSHASFRLDPQDDPRARLGLDPGEPLMFQIVSVVVPSDAGALESRLEVHQSGAPSVINTFGLNSVQELRPHEMTFTAGGSVFAAAAGADGAGSLQLGQGETLVFYVPPGNISGAGGAAGTEPYVERPGHGRSYLRPGQAAALFLADEPGRWTFGANLTIQPQQWDLPVVMAVAVPDMD